MFVDKKMNQLIKKMTDELIQILVAAGNNQNQI